MGDLDRTLNRVLNDFFGDFPVYVANAPGAPAGRHRGGRGGGRGTGKRTEAGPTVEWVPHVDVLDAGDSYMICADLPGVTKENVKIDLTEDSTMTISGERPQPETYEKAQPLSWLEMNYGKFERHVPLPMGKFDSNKVEAKMENGVLHIKIGKAEQAQPKSIQIA
ncbi:HSP20-like chaperone [Fimicolochytrium jonesii]|uniref:HSP20-like chaperone n=1 Tax=Fimicolochytrium jonesii TaxID=1396493 RepID=UPI0022FEF79A|nr:HSP20-like chaperone [Fimicolochytrium jonesii]KAI8824490.1 HSP20-like chaperone [Fimicolochytrium jonesii]